jgi:hypothetical protein
MVAPYRSPSAQDDGASEAREIEAFARAMHAERRVWGNENLGHAISCALGAVCIAFLCCLRGGWVFIIMEPLYLALLVVNIRRWRAAVARSAPSSIPPAA